MAARYDCEVCCGAGLVRLALHRAVRAAPFDAAIEPTVEQSWRDYPCPECADMIPLARVATVEFHSLLDTRIHDPEFTKHARRRAVQGMLAGIFNKGFVTFEMGKPNTYQMTRPMIATLGVVSPTKIASIEERVAQRQNLVAQAVLDRAARRIRAWASNQQGPTGSVPKEVAIGDFRDALVEVLAEPRAALEALRQNQL